MNRCFHALADYKVASSLDSVPFLTNIANKFITDFKRKWIKTAVKITNTSGYVASFKDLTFFLWNNKLVFANSTFALKLFSSSSSESDLPKSSQSRNGQFNASKTISFQAFAKTESKVDYSCCTVQLSVGVALLEITNCSSVSSFARFLFMKDGRPQENTS